MLGATFGPWLGCDTENGAASDAGLITDAAAPSPTQCLPLLTPRSGFFQQFGGSGTVPDWTLPELDASSFRVRIEGLVDRPLELSLAELEADLDNHVSVLGTLMCVKGNHGTGIWTGIPLRVLLDRAGIDRSRTARLRLWGADGFGNNLRIADVYESPAELFEPLLVFWLYGERLPAALGFPFRLRLADRYGFKNVKWLARIEATDIDEPFGHYQDLGIDDEAFLQPVPTVDAPPPLQTVQAGPVEVCGYALSGYGGVEAVEVAVNGGPYRPARLATLEEVRERHPELEQVLQLEQPDRFAYPFRAVFVVWRIELQLPWGDHLLAIRCRDSSGRVGDGTGVLITAT